MQLLLYSDIDWKAHASKRRNVCFTSGFCWINKSSWSKGGEVPFRLQGRCHLLVIKQCVLDAVLMFAMLGWGTSICESVMYYSL